jgi:hypothetical protein
MESGHMRDQGLAWRIRLKSISWKCCEDVNWFRVAQDRIHLQEHDKLLGSVTTGNLNSIMSYSE